MRKLPGDRSQIRKRPRRTRSRAVEEVPPPWDSRNAHPLGSQKQTGRRAMTLKNTPLRAPRERRPVELWPSPSDRLRGRMENLWTTRDEHTGTNTVLSCPQVFHTAPPLAHNPTGPTTTGFLFTVFSQYLLTHLMHHGASGMARPASQTASMERLAAACTLLARVARIAISRFEKWGSRDCTGPSTVPVRKAPK